MWMWISNIKFSFKIGLYIKSLEAFNYLAWLVHCIEMIKSINIYFFINSYLWTHCHDNSKCIWANFVWEGINYMWLMTKGARLSTIIPLLTTYLLTTKISISTLMSILSLKCIYLTEWNFFLVCCYLSYNSEIQFIWFIFCLWQFYRLC